MGYGVNANDAAMINCGVGDEEKRTRGVFPPVTYSNNSFYTILIILRTRDWKLCPLPYTM